MPLFSSRRIAEGIYGGHLPRDVAAAVALGLVIGAITGGNLSWAALLLAAILLNVHTRLFLAAWLASLLLAWLAGGCLESLGRLLLDGTPLAHAIGSLGDGALLALLGWDQYAIIGGLAAGAGIGLVAALAAYRTTARFSRRWPEIDTTRTTAEAAGPAGKLPAGNGPMVCIWLGRSSRERSVRRTMTPHRLRRCGVPAALAASLALAAAGWQLAGAFAERELFHALSAYNGTEVSSGRTQFSLWSGDFVVRDLQIADPLRPDRDRLRIGVAQGRLSPGLLLRGHLDVEKLTLQHVRTDVARRQPARLCGALVKPEPLTISDAAPRPGEVEIDSYLRHWKPICRQLAKLQQLITAVEQLSRAEDAGEWSASARHNFGRRSDLGAGRPCIVVRQARIADLAGGLILGPRALLELTHLSSNPAMSRATTEIKIVLPKFGAEVRLEFAGNNSGMPHTLRCSACDVELAPLIDAPGSDCAVLVEAGRARLTGEGTFDRQRFDLRLLVEAQSLAAEVVANHPLAGIEPALWNRGLKQLAAFHAEVAVAGPWSSPSVVADDHRLVEQFKHQLRAAREHELVAVVEQQVAQYERGQAESQVMQATALEPQTRASQPGLCEFADEDPAEPTLPAQSDAALLETTDNTAPQAIQYPTTSVPDDELANGPPPTALPPAETAVVRRRPLPGPVNMVVGRDAYSGLASTPAARGGLAPAAEPSAHRDNPLSRWTQGLRQKLGQTFSRPEAGPEDSDPPSDPDLAPNNDRSIPAAASDTWYNRRWR